MSIRPRTLAAIAVASALVLGLVSAPAQSASAAALTRGTLAALTAPSGKGIIAPVKPRTLIGGSTGLAVRAGTALSAPVSSLGSLRQALVQVTVTGSPQPGMLTLWAPGPRTPLAPSLTFDRGSSSTTTLLTFNDLARLRILSSQSARVTVTLLATVSGTPATPPAPGGTGIVAPYAVIDSASRLGGVLPGVEETATVPVAGLGGVPSENLRAVWLSVQSIGGNPGTLEFAHTAGETAAVATVAADRWSTSLVLASVAPDGTINYTVRGSAPRQLKVAVVGWVAGATSTQSSLSVVGGLQPITPHDLAVTSMSSSAAVLFDARATGSDLPTAATTVLVRATVSMTSRSGGVYTGATSLQAVARGSFGVPLPSGATSQVTFAATRSATGALYVALPTGATLRELAVVGYFTKAVTTTADKVTPALTVDALAGPVDLADTAVFTLSGNASDDTSGIRSVTATIAKKPIGAATVDYSTGSGAWSLNTSAPPGTHSVLITATDWAGRTTTRTVTVTVTAPSKTETVVAPTAEVLTTPEIEAIGAVTDTSLTVESATPYQIGSIIVSGATEATPFGLLRRVTGVSEQAGSTVVLTETVSLTEVLLQADIHASDIPLGGDDTIIVNNALVARGTTGIVNGRGVKPSLSILPVTKTFETGKIDLSPTVSASAKLDVSTRLTIDMQVDIEWSWGIPHPKLSEFSTIFTAKAEISADVTASAAMGKKLKPKLFNSLRLGVVTFTIGPVPVVITASLKPQAELGAEVGGKVALEYSAEYAMKSGVKYSNDKWTQVRELSSEAELKPVAEVYASVSATLGFSFAAKLYDVAGPYAELKAGLALVGKIDAVKRKTSLSLDGSITGSVGVVLEVLDVTLADWSTKLLDLKKNFFTWEHKWDSVPPTNPNGPGGSIYSWGPNHTSWLLDATDEAGSTVPIRLAAAGSAVGISSRGGTAYARRSDGTVVSWGSNINSTLGQGFPEGQVTPPTQSAPGVLPNLTNTESVAANPMSETLFAVRTDGTVRAWGNVYRNSMIAPGDDVWTYDAPTLVPGLTNVKTMVSGNGDSTFAIKRDGTVLTAGDNTWGERCVGVIGDKIGLTAASSLTGTKKIVPLPYSTLVLKVDGTVWTCGQRSDGTMGAEPDSLPHRVSGISGVVDIARLWDRTIFAVKSDGTVWTWSGSSPEQVPGITNVASVTDDGFMMYALKRDGTVWTWGRGWLGNGEGSSTSTVPVQVVGLTGVTQIAAGVALK